MDLFTMFDTSKNIQKLDEINKKTQEGQYKVVVCQSCGKPNMFSYKTLYEKAKTGRKVIKKCQKCNESIIFKKD